MGIIYETLLEINKIEKSRLRLLERSALLKPLREKLKNEVEKIKMNPLLELSRDEKLEIYSLHEVIEKPRASYTALLKDLNVEDAID